MMDHEFFFEEGDLLEQVELYQVLNEGLFDKLPPEINKLKKDIKEEIKKFNDEQKSKSFGDRFKMTRTQIKDLGKANINKIITKMSIKIYGHIIITTTDSYGNETSSYEHVLICLYKDYALRLSIKQSRMWLSGGSVKVLYDNDKCSIPNNVVFDVIGILQPIRNISTSKNSIKVEPYYSSSVDNGLPKIENKYGKEYEVKKNFGGFSITIGNKKEK